MGHCVSSPWDVVILTCKADRTKEAKIDSVAGFRDARVAQSWRGSPVETASSNKTEATERWASASNTENAGWTNGVCEKRCG
jgi:hypothetical protein